MTEDRPVLIVSLTPLQTFFLTTGGLLVFVQWVFLFRDYGGLPGIVPSHYNAHGEVDGNANKSTLFLLPAITTLLFVLMIILYRFPHMMNYPIKVTPENAKNLYRLSIDLVCYMAFALSATMFYLTYQTIRVAQGYAVGLGAWSVLFFLGLIFVPMVYVIIRMFKMK
jgi:uncharacterized membrane protein